MDYVSGTIERQVSVNYTLMQQNNMALASLA